GERDVWTTVAQCALYGRVRVQQLDGSADQSRCELDQPRARGDSEQSRGEDLWNCHRPAQPPDADRDLHHRGRRVESVMDPTEGGLGKKQKATAARCVDESPARGEDL